MEELPELALHDVIFRSGAAGAAVSSAVSRRFNECASDDLLWRRFCLQDFDLAAMADPAGDPTSSFKDTYKSWRESFGMYPLPLVRRVKRCWTVIKTWLAEKFPEAANVLLDGASEAELNELEIELGLKLPLTTRLLYRFCSGQKIQGISWDKIEKYDNKSLGIIGGYCFGTYTANVHLVSLQQIVMQTKIFRKHFGSPKFFQHITVAACPYDGGIYFFHCGNCQLYVGTKNLTVDGEMLACVPDALIMPGQTTNDSQQQDGLLLWLEEHGRRLQSGMIGIRSDGKNRMISLFPEVEPLCSTAVTNCVQVRASAVLVPKLCDLRSDKDKYRFAYSVRMCLLPDVYALDGLYFNRCQLSSRHWIIRAKDTVVADVGGEGVDVDSEHSLFPLLHPDGKEFVYESCTTLPYSPGSIEGAFTFVPGRLLSPEGSPFCVQVARFPLDKAGYIF